MSNPRYLLKTDFHPEAALHEQGRLVLEQHDRLAGFLARRGGPALAGFFATPLISYGNDVQAPSISWYADAVGDPVALTALAGGERAEAEAVLSARLAALALLLDDPGDGALLRRALLVPRLGDVVRVGDTVVLTNWGMTVPGSGDGPRILNGQFAATLGRYAPFATLIPDRQTEPEAMAAKAVPVAAAAAATALPPPRPTTTSPPMRGTAPALLVLYSLLIVLAVAAVAVAAGYYLGWRSLVADLQATRPPPPDPGVTQSLIETQRQINDGLRRQIAAAESGLTRNVCTAENPTGQPPAPTATPVRRSDSPGAPAFQGNLADLLDRSVVMVMVADKEKSGHGTGFLIAPDLVVTNAHVAEVGAGGKILVLSKQLNAVRPAEVVAMSQAHTFLEPDFAVLRVPGLTGLTVLQLATAAERLEPVVAAGYPGLVLETDEGYKRVSEGDLSAIPESSLTSGEISAVQTDFHGTRIIHTAIIRPGNSGGPVTDRCGRVLGVNSWGKTDKDNVAVVYYAQAAASLVDFLKANNLAAAVTAEPCRVQAAAATPVSPPASVPAPAPAPAPAQTQAPVPGPVPAQPQPPAAPARP